MKTLLQASTQSKAHMRLLRNLNEVFRIDLLVAERSRRRAREKDREGYKEAQDMETETLVMTLRKS